MSISENVADLMQNIRYSGIPDEVLIKSKHCILDCIGVAIAGTANPVNQCLTEYLRQVGGDPVASVIGQKQKTSVLSAAFANGVLGHVLDYDDTTGVYIGHPTVATVPAILALAEQFGGSGEQVVHAYVVGAEVQWAFGAALVRKGNHYAKGFHSTGTVGTLGAAAAAATFLQLDRQQTAMALGLAASMAAGFQAQFGTHAKSFHAGRAAENGVKAALLARAGFTSALNAFESKVGFFNVVSDTFDTDRLSGIGTTWGLTVPSFYDGITLKAYPVLAGGLGAIEGALVARNKHRIRIEDIESIACRIQPFEVPLLPYHRPRNGLEAKFSVEYWVAATLVYGRLGLAELRDEAVMNPQVQELIQKSTVSADASIPVAQNHVKIQIRTRDGAVYDIAEFPFKGTPENPMTESDLVDKFMDCSDYANLSADKAKEAVDRLLGLDREESLVPLMNIVSGRA